MTQVVLIIINSPTLQLQVQYSNCCICFPRKFLHHALKLYEIKALLKTNWHWHFLPSIFFWLLVGCLNLFVINLQLIWERNTNMYHNPRNTAVLIKQESCLIDELSLLEACSDTTDL